MAYKIICYNVATKIESKTSPRCFKTRQYAPGCPKRRLKFRQDIPTRPQDAPMTPPKAPPRRSKKQPRRRKTHPRRLKTRQRRPDKLQEPPKPPPDLDVGSFWRRFWLIFLRCWRILETNLDRCSVWFQGLFSPSFGSRIGLGGFAKRKEVIIAKSYCS